MRWYSGSQAHNTVVVDGSTQRARGGECTLWYVQEPIQVVRASAPGDRDLLIAIDRESPLQLGPGGCAAVG